MSSLSLQRFRYVEKSLFMKSGRSLAKATQGWSSSNGLGLLGAVPILTSEQDLNSVITSATAHASDTTLNDEQSQDLGALVNVLKTDTTSLLEAMKAKKTDFANVGALGIARSSIATLTTAQDKYSDSLIKAASVPYKAKGQQDKADFDALFQEAATYYST